MEKELEIEKYASCAKCSGSGSRSGGGGVKPCSSCGGRGVVAQQRGIFIQQATCPECRGAGQVISDPCEDCNGDGRAQAPERVSIRIPAGVDDGTRLRSTGKGDAGLRGGPAGDLYVFLHLEDHDIFQRDGDDLFCEIPVPFQPQLWEVNSRCPLSPVEPRLKFLREPKDPRPSGCVIEE